MITFKNRALGALSNIEVELKRRADLIPNLAEAVKGYAGLEQSVQQFVALARAGVFYSSDERAPKASKLVPALLAVVEKYPELKASENFLHLMREISDTENRIAYSREFYNRNAQKYTTTSEQFPYLLVAQAFGFKPMQFISIAESM
jgi:LemA protein